MRRRDPIVSTYSIVARDPENGDLGVAVASKFPAVGAGVPYARATVGAVATQADANFAWGPDGLALLAEGRTAQQALEQLIARDAAPGGRQAGIVDAQGGAATYTGPDCYDWAGGLTGDGFCCQGNILTGPEVVQAMAEGYTTADGLFSNRLLTALEAGQAAGGDSRGRQSAAILIVRERGGHGGKNDRWLDMRVDDHPDPLPELRRLVNLHRVYFNTDDAQLLPLDDTLLARIAANLTTLGHLPAADTNRSSIEAALRRWGDRENLEARQRDDGTIDTVVLEMLEEQARRSDGAN